jgi:hypothetical protein
LRGVPPKENYLQLLIMLAIIPLCVAFGYAMAAVLDDGSIIY